MRGLSKSRTISAVLGTTALALVLAASPAWADEPTNEELLGRIEALEKVLESVPAMQQELQALRAQISQSNQRVDKAENRAKAAEAKAEAASRSAENAAASASGDGPLPDTKWHLSGYADAGAQFMSSNLGNDTFAFGHFNPVLHFQYKDIVMFEGELEFEIDDDGETEVKLEYAAMNFLVHDNATIVLGKFISPVGQFQERLHPSWINKIGNAPAGFGHDGVQPEADVGVQVRGGFPFGDRGLFTYVLALGNGPRLGHETNPAFEGFGRDDNSNKSFSGRLGFLPLPYLEFGVSYLTGKVNGLDHQAEGAHPEAYPAHVELEPTVAKVKIWGADAAFTRGPWDFRFEYLKSVRDPINSFSEEEEEVVMFPTLTMKAWYLQLAYRLSEVSGSPFFQNLEPVVRYGRFNISGHDELFEENAQKRLNFGLNYWVAPSVVARIGYERRRFLDDGRVEKVFMVQGAYGF